MSWLRIAEADNLSESKTSVAIGATTKPAVISPYSPNLIDSLSKSTDGKTRSEQHSTNLIAREQSHESLRPRPMWSDQTVMLRGLAPNRPRFPYSRSKRASIPYDYGRASKRSTRRAKQRTPQDPADLQHRPTPHHRTALTAAPHIALMSLALHQWTCPIARRGSNRIEPRCRNY